MLGPRVLCASWVQAWVAGFSRLITCQRRRAPCGESCRANDDGRLLILFSLFLPSFLLFAMDDMPVIQLLSLRHPLLYFADELGALATLRNSVSYPHLFSCANLTAGFVYVQRTRA